MSKWIAEFDLEDGDTMPEDMDLNCMGAHIDFHCRPMWISVRERLPEIGQCVLLSLRSLDIEVGFRAETEPYFYCHNADSCYIEPQNILAWQPLPQPYKERLNG